MATPAQIKANRKNAQKSTGPRTPLGKAVASQNSTTHGLRSNRILITSDDPAEFAAHRTALLAELAPVGPMEAFLANRIVILTWHLTRAVRLQSESINTLAGEETNAPHQPPLERLPDWMFWDDNFIRKIGLSQKKYEAMTDENVLEKYIRDWITDHPKELDEFYEEHEEYSTPEPAANDKSDQGPLSLGRMAVRDFSDTRVLERLLMYERRVENSLYKTHLELQRLQNRRKADEQQAS